MVSKMAGTTEVLNHSRNVTLDRITGEPQVSDGASQTSRPLIYPHEVGELASDEMLVFCESVNGVIRAKRKPYTDEPGLDYSENPYYDEPGLFKSLFDSIFGS
jgi:type IV secretory pathway TraG/TraD family ATPase VirD4